MPIFNQDLPGFDKPLEGFPEEGNIYKGKVLPDTLHPSVPNLGQTFGDSAATGSMDIDDLARMNSFKSGPVFGSTINELSKNKRYDFYKPGVNYEDIYARTQPWYKQIGNGLVKAGAFALGTFLQSFNSIPETFNAIAKGDLSELSGNDSYTSAIDNWYKNLEDVFPNYYSDYEKAHPFESILGSGFANTLGDKLIKNVGFMAGSIGGAVVQDAIIGTLTDGLGEIPLVANQIGKASLWLNKIFSTETAIGRGLGSAEKGILTSFLESGSKAGYTTEQLSRMKGLAELAASKKIGNQFRYGLNLWTASLTEAGVESRDGYRTLKNDLVDQYKLENFGQNPTGKDLQDIEDIATSSMNARMIGNLGILMASNAIQFENILRPFSSAKKGVTSPIFQEIEGKRVGLQNGLMGGYSEIVPKTFLGKVTRGIQPYIPELFAEGVFEEGGQYALERGTYDYYNKKYLDRKNNKSRNDIAEFIDSLGKGLSDQFTTTAGLENMFLGALTAGLTGKAKSVYTNVTGNGPKARVAAEINNLNSHQLMGVFENNFENAAQQLQASKDMKSAVEKKDIFSYKNAQFKSLFSWVNSRLQGNRYGLLQEEIKLATELPDDQFKQMFGFDANSDNRNVVSQYMSLVQEQANKIKSNYDKVNEFFVNPYKYIRTPKTEEERVENDNHRRYEDYKTTLTYFPSLIDNADKRTADMQKDLITINPMLSTDVVKKLGSVESLLDLSKEYEQEATNSLKLVTELTSPQDRKKFEQRAKDLRNYSEAIYKLANDAIAQKEDVPDKYLKLFNNLVNFELNGRDASAKEIYLKHPLDVEKAVSFAVDLNKLEDMKKEAREAFDILTDPKKGFEEFQRVDETRLPPQHAPGSALTPGREYSTENLGKYKIKKLAGDRYQVISPDKSIVSTHATKEEASATTKYLNNNLNNLKKVKIVRDNGDGTIRITDTNGDIQDIPKQDILKYTPLETQAEKLAKQKDQIKAEQADLQGDSGTVNTNPPTETIGKESALVDANIMFISSITESEGSDDPNWQKNAAASPTHIKNSREFLNTAATLPNRSSLRAILVTPLLEKTYGLEGLAQISYGVKDEDLQTEEQKQEFVKRVTDVDNGLIAQVFVEQVGSDLYFIDKKGNKLGKLGEPLSRENLASVVFQTMKRPILKDSKGGSRVRSGQEAEAEAYLEAWKKQRAIIFATDPNASPTIYAFNVSRGIAEVGNQPNTVAGTLISSDPVAEREILKGQSIIQIPTNKVITFKGRAINFPNGRPVLVYGDNVEFLNNIKLDGKRAQAIYAVLEKMANDINERAKAGKKIIFSKTKEAKFLQNILYWKEGETKSESNQINISEDGTSISFGGKTFPIDQLAENKSAIIDELSKAYHNVNNKTLSEEMFSKPFTEFYLEKGELKSRDWSNYQTYLLSSTLPDGSKRSVADIPLTTKILTPSDAVPYTHKQKYSTLIGLDLPIGTIKKPAAVVKEVAAPKGKFEYDGTTPNTAPVLTFGDVVFTVDKSGDPIFDIESNEFKSTKENLIKKLKQSQPESTEEWRNEQAENFISNTVRKQIQDDLNSIKASTEAETKEAEITTPTAPGSVEDKKADIRKRKEEDKMPSLPSKENKKTASTYDRELEEWANRQREYDKELASLEKAPTKPAPVSTDAKADVEKLKQTSEGKQIEEERQKTIRSVRMVKDMLGAAVYEFEVRGKKDSVIGDQNVLYSYINSIYDAELAALEEVKPAETYKDVTVINTTEITTQTGEPGAASYNRKNNTIKLNREFLKKKFDEKAWTKPRKQRDGSYATALPENAFATYEEFEKFVIEHEFQHSLLSYEDSGATNVGEYEDIINRKALGEEVKPATPTEEKPKFDPKKIGGRGKKFRAVSELLDSRYRMTDEDVAIFKEWHAEKVPQIPYEVLEQMVSMNPDRKAWGVYEDGVAKFVRGGLKGTEYHEVFHGIWTTLLTPDERVAITKEFNSREGSFKDRLSGKTILYANATEEQVEDKLADDFTDYRKGKVAARTLGEAIRNFFKRIMDFFKAFVSKPTLKDQLFDDIEKGKFADRELSTDTKAVAPRYRAVEGLDEQQTNAFVQDMTALAAAIIRGNGEIGVIDKSSLFDFKKLTGTEVFDKIKEIYTEQGGIMDQFSDTTWKQLVERTRRSLRANLKVSFNEEDLVNINDENTSNRDYAPEPFQVDIKKSAPVAIKFVTSTLPKTVAMDQTGKLPIELPDLKEKNGLYSLVPFNAVFSTLIQKFSNTSINKIGDKLFELAQKDSDYARLFEVLGGDIETGKIPFGNFKYNDWRLFGEFFKVFTKQKPNATIQYLSKGQVYSGSALVTDIVNVTVKGWMQNVRNLAKDKDSIIKWDGVKKAYIVKEGVAGIPIDKPKEQLDFINKLGIEFSKDVYDRLSSKEKNDFAGDVAAIKNTLAKTGEIINVQKKTLDIDGPLKSIAEKLVNVTNPAQSNTRININGNQTNSFASNNTPSIFETTFNEVGSLDELLEIRPELKDVFSASSQVLKKGGIFFDENGKRTGVPLKVGYVEGINNNDTASGKTVANLTKGEKLSLEINQNIDGQYYVLIPADSTTEWMMNLGNSISFSEVETEEAWDKINDIFKGYLIDEVNLALDADNRSQLRNVGDKATDLRFFQEILSEKHLSDIEEMINTDRPFSEIEAYINENFNDKEGEETIDGEKKITPGIASDIKSFINTMVADTRGKMMETGVLKTIGENTYSYESLNSSFAAKEKLNKNLLNDEDVNNIVTFANANYIINNIEFHKILFGDPYQFAIKEGILDETKRIKSFLSPAEQTFDTKEFNTFLNGDMNSVAGIQLSEKDFGYHRFKSYTRTATLNDVIVASELANDKSLSENIRKQFMKVNEADAASVLEIGTYREIKIKNQQWNKDGVEEEWYQWQMAYTRQNMPGYTYTNPILEEHDKALISKPEPKFTVEDLKPIVRGVKNNSNKIELVLDKFSQMPIYYKAVKGTSLEKLYLKMVDPNIPASERLGYAIMISGRKVGAEDLNELYKDGKFNEEPFKGIVDVPWKIYGIQVENSYEGPGMQTRGSQLTKLSTLDLYTNGEPIGDSIERKQVIKNAVERNKRALDIYHEAKYEQFLKKTGLEDLDGVYRIVDRPALAKALQDEMFRRALPENVVDAIQTDENNQFLIPFEASNSYVQIRDILYSFVDKALGSPKMSGGSYVQVPVTGWENAEKGRGLAEKLKEGGYRKISTEEYEKMEDKSDIILTEDTLKIYEDKAGKRYCEVMIPHWFRDLGKFSKLTDEQIIQKLNTPEGRKILTGVGFRIPTQALSSAEVFVVAGFLPQSMGKTVVVPSAITTKAGSDFDIDKLNMYLKATYVDKTGNLRLVTLEGNKDQTKDFYRKVFSDKLAGQKMYKAELLEAVQIASLTLDDPKNLVDKYSHVLNVVLEGITDSSDYEQKIIDDLQELGNENIQSAYREKFAEEMYIKALENEYYDSLQELLTLPENFKRLVNPVDDNGLKDISKDIDKLKGYDETKIKARLLNRVFMGDQRHAFLTAKKWIGIIAVNITGHSVAQKSKIYFDPERINTLKDKEDANYLKYNNGAILLDHNTVEVDGKPYASISGIFDATGKNYISNALSGYATAAVDVAKDPYLLKIIKSDLLISPAMALVRLGVPKRQMEMFLNQPVIDKYIELLDKKKSSTLFDSRNISELEAMFPHKLSDITNTFDKTNLEENIKKYHTEGLSDKENGEQIAIFKEFLKYAKLAEYSFSLSQASNYDTTKFRSAESLSGKQYRTEFAEDYNVFTSVDELLRNSHIGTQAMYLDKGTDALAEYLILDKPEFMVITDSLMEPYYMDKYLSKVKRDRIGNKMKAALLDFIIQRRTDIASNLNADLVDTATSVAIMLTKAKTEFPGVKIINDLEVDSSGRIGGAQTIKLRVNDKSKDSVDMYTGMMRELRDDPRTNALYNGIVKLAILQGTYQSPISIKNIIPVEDYAAKITPIIAGLKADDEIRTFATSYEFQRNEFKDDAVVPIVTPRFREVEGTDAYNDDAPRQFQAAFVKVNTRMGEMTFPGQFPAVAGLGLKTMQRQLMFLNEKYDAKAVKYDVVKVPRTIPVNKKNAEEGKLDVATGMQITNQMYAEKAKKGDTSLENFYGYQKVKNADGSPVIARYDRDGNAIYVYKFINLHGDGEYATEYYGDGRPSVFSNGSQKNIITTADGSKVSGEIADSVIANLYADKISPKASPVLSDIAISSESTSGAEELFEQSFTPERQAEILKNFSDKHKMTNSQALSYIKEAIVKEGQKVIDKLNECY